MTLLRRLGAALHSLRWRLTLTYLALIAVLLTALGAWQYLTLRSSLIDSRVSDLKADLVAAQKLYQAEEGTTTLTAAEKIAQLAQLISQSSGSAAVVAIYGPAGRQLLVRPVGQNPPQLDAVTFTTVLTGRSEQHEVVDLSSGSQLVVGFPLDSDLSLRRAAAVVEVSESMASVNSVLGSDLAKLAIGGGAVLLLALILGLLIVSQALRPLRRLTATAGELAAGDLRARSRLYPRSDEVGQLATAFDNMADRIESAFAAQRESEGRVRRFVADASHELRTPVTALAGYIDVLRRGAAQDARALSASLGAMAREADRLRVLVSDLLTLARLDAQAQQRVEDVDVSQAVGQLLDEGVPGMPLQVIRDFSSDPVIARIDRGSLTTVVRNLLINACKYAPGARQVWSVRVDGRRARLDAHDEGPGIPLRDLPYVFERFYRGEKTRSREEGGSGLGLSIVAGLVRAQGGDVAIASTEGAGTTVTVWLPLGGGGPPPVGRPPAGGGIPRSAPAGRPPGVV